MKILILDTWSNALDFAMRCQSWGHEVVYYNQPKKNGEPRCCGEGIVPLLRDFEQLRKKWLGWADLIYLPDNTAYLAMLEPLRSMGYPVFGCNAEAAELELDRAIGAEYMKKCGFNIIPTKEFHSYEDAARFARKNPQYLVCKPSGDADKKLSYVAHDLNDLMYMLEERWPENEKYVKDVTEHGLILQEKKTGCEMAVGGWFGPHGWNEGWLENFEFKKFMAGDCGQSTGEQGTLAMYVRDSRLADMTLKKMTTMLRELDYVGYFDVNGCIDESGKFWPYEFTCRDGWPTRHNHQSLMVKDCDPAKWMLDLVNGYDTMEMMANTASISIVVTLPPYPNIKDDTKDVEGIPILGNIDFDHIHLSDCMLDDNAVPRYVASGHYVMVVTGTGETITGARRSALAALDKIWMPSDPQYRTDIGRGRLVEQMPMIQGLGHAKAFKY